MAMSSQVAPTVAEVHRALLNETSGSSELFMTGFTEETTAAVIAVLGDLDEPPTIRLLASESVLKWLRRDFHLASTAADLVAAEKLSLRTAEESVRNAVVVGEESVVSLVVTSGRAAGLHTDDTVFVENMREQFSDAWKSAEAFDLRTPPRSRVYETLTEEIGAEVAADLQTVFDAVETTRSGGYGSTDDDPLDEVGLTLLAAAKHDVQLYEISRWGENVGLASKATFSRAKGRLEEQGMIATEKVPIDVGRPRLRLMFSADQLREVEASDLPDAVREMLASAAA